MQSLARWCFRHRKIVLLAWIAALIVVGAIAHAAGSSYSNNFSFPSTDSSKALAVEQANFPARSGDSEQIVVQAKSGTLTDPDNQAAVQSMLSKVSDLKFVTEVASPYTTHLISKDGTIGLATVQLDAQAQNVPTSQAQKLVKTAQDVNPHVLNVQLGGAAVEEGENQGGGNADFLVGIVLALVILFFAFRRSFLAALLPLLTAVIAIGIGTSIIGLLSHAFSVPEFATQLAELIALGVGVDYSLFIVNRHRRELLAGHSHEEAAVRALNTSGRAVFVAGLTVCIALLGMFALALTFLYGVSLGAAFVVLLTMLSALTLLPAMLGFYGDKVLSRPDRRALRGNDAAAAEALTKRGASPFWTWWAGIVQRRRVLLAIASAAVIIVIALPFFSMRLGIADSSEDPSGSTTQQAYTLLAKGFGPGFNGPLQLVGSIAEPGDLAKFNSFADSIKGQDGVAAVEPTTVSPNGKAAVALVYPTSSPQSSQTTDLVNHLRSEVPAAEAGSTLAIHVGGQTAAAVDFSNVLSSKLPLFVAVIIVLASLLLAAVFRSLLIPLTASVMNLLSIGAALGAIVAAFQFGWLRPILGFASPGPIEVYLPVMMFAVLFGLSMDYEVFLVSRMHEEWLLSGDNSKAVRTGQAETGRVITAAGLIMICVFLSFSLINNALVIQEFGIGFAVAIIIDAFIVRTILVPALMHIFGKANWWLPKWLDRLLPTVHIEAEEEPEEPKELVNA